MAGNHAKFNFGGEMQELFPMSHILQDPPIDKETFFVVLARWEPHKNWRIFNDQFVTKEAAISFATELNCGWRYKRILKIEVGG